MSLTVMALVALSRVSAQDINATVGAAMTKPKTPGWQTAAATLTKTCCGSMSAGSRPALTIARPSQPALETATAARNINTSSKKMQALRPSRGDLAERKRMIMPWLMK